MKNDTPSKRTQRIVFYAPTPIPSLERGQRGLSNESIKSENASRTAEQSPLSLDVSYDVTARESKTQFEMPLTGRHVHIISDQHFDLDWTPRDTINRSSAVHEAFADFNSALESPDCALSNDVMADGSLNTIC